MPSPTHASAAFSPEYRENFAACAAKTGLTAPFADVASKDSGGLLSLIRPSNRHDDAFLWLILRSPSDVESSPERNR